MRGLRAKFYVFQTSFQLLFWVPFFYQIQKTSGISPKEIFLIQTIYYLSFAFFEIPTGVIADKLGNKISLIVSSFLMLIANLLTTMSFAPSVFLVHFLTLALSRSFFSGASQAWLYSELESRKESEQFKDILGTSRSLSLLSRTIAWIVGGYIVEFNSHYIYGLTAFSSLIALASAITISDRTTTQKQIDNRQSGH